jgi:hypothetical protein
MTLGADRLLGKSRARAAIVGATPASPETLEAPDARGASAVAMSAPNSMRAGHAGTSLLLDREGRLHPLREMR